MWRRWGSIKLMDVLGIRIGVDATWFLTLFLVLVWLEQSFRATLNNSSAAAYAVIVVTALLFFASLIVHELGHALMARRQGVEVRRIQLFLFGGMTQMSREAQSPAEEFKIAAAGPLATLGVVLLVAVIDLAVVGPHRLWHAFWLDGSVKVTAVLLALSWLLLMNLVVLVFNLVPAFPLDGGRMVRALVWRLSDDKRRGTRAAAQLGQVFALMLGGFGIWLTLSGGGFGAIWLLLLAFLLGQSARGALVHSTLSERIDTVRVADIMDRQPVAIPARTPIAQALDEFFLRYGWQWFPVVDDHGHFLGVARQERLQAAHDQGQDSLGVGGLLEASDARESRVSEDRPLSELIQSESLGRLGALMAVDADGILRGVVTVEQVRRALQSAFGSPVA
jgi:Zn-dependent protease